MECCPVRNTSLQKTIERAHRIKRIAHDDDIAPAFGDVMPTQMAFEGARAGLIAGDVDTHVMRHFDPWHGGGNFVKGHVAAAAKAVHDLLHPRGAAFGIW